MQVTLKVQNFQPDYDNQATVIAYTSNGFIIGEVKIEFADDHRIVPNFAFDNGCVHHTTQAQIILRASEMIDSFFTEDNPDVGPAVHDEITV